jgi:hypothetical protein
MRGLDIKHVVVIIVGNPIGKRRPVSRTAEKINEGRFFSNNEQ